MKPLFQMVDQSRKAAVEEALLAAAERVLDKKGYDSATMRDIAKEAGCSNGSLYIYFVTKEELFDALISMHICRLIGLMMERMRAAGDPIAQLRAGNRALLEYFSEHQGFFRIFFAGRTSRAGFELGLIGAGRKAYEDLRKYELSIMEQARRDGRVRTDIPATELIAFVHDVAIAAMARWTRTDEPEALSKHFDLLWQFTSRGLGLGPEEV
jgi:AcrR family transcriptional regulator